MLNLFSREKNVGFKTIDDKQQAWTQTTWMKIGAVLVHGARVSSERILFIGNRFSREKSSHDRLGFATLKRYENAKTGNHH